MPSTSQNSDALIVEAIREVGVGNYSEISRRTGVNSETIRYKIKKGFAKKGLAIRTAPNYNRLGLALKWLNLTFSPQCEELGGRILDRLAKIGYLMYFGKRMAKRSFAVILSIPPKHWTEYKDFLQALTERGIIESLDCDDLACMRNISIRPQFYDFGSRGWAVEWKDLEALRITPEPVSFEVDEDPALDSLDLRILAELQTDATLPLAKIAQRLGVKPNNLRYHFWNHVIRKALISGHHVRWVGKSREERENLVVRLMFAFRGLQGDESFRLQALFNKFPFTTLELASDHGTYYVFASIPVNHLVPATKYLTDKVRGLEGKMKISVIDPTLAAAYTFPLEMFDDKRGWTWNKALALQEINALVPSVMRGASSALLTPKN